MTGASDGGAGVTTAPVPAAPGQERRELGLAVALCLLGSALVLLAVSREWADVAVQGRPAPLPDTGVEVRGDELVPGARALALVGLAGAVALLAARRTGRLAVGLLVALCGLGVAVLTGRLLGGLGRAAAATASVGRLGPVGPGTTDATGWPWACLAGGLVLAAAGLLTAARGRRWAAMSRRYDAPSVPRTEPEPPVGEASAEAAERALWEALDRGEDPTRGRGHEPGRAP